VEELDKSVNELKKTMSDAKLKAKQPGDVMGATPPTASCNATPERSANFSPLRQDLIRRLKSDDDKSDSSFGLVCQCFPFADKYFDLQVNKAWLISFLLDCSLHRLKTKFF